MNILICIPTYNEMIHSKLCMNLLSLNELKIPFTVKFLCGSLIPRLRNQFLTFFYDHQEYTHLLFIDADMFDFDKTLVQMIWSKKDVIGGVYRKKMKTEEYNICTFDYGIDHSDPYPEVKYLATGLLMISRQAVQNLINKYPENTYQDRGKRYFDFFMCGIVNDRYLSEDFGFCELYRGTGGSLYCVLDSEITHHGIMNYRGNFKEYILKIKS